jgi:outer membrane protein OmpA-like peptidoglycan-associated protein
MLFPTIMRFVQKISIFIGALFLLGAPLLAQVSNEDSIPRKQVRIGITGGYALNRHTADFLQFDGFAPFLLSMGGNVLPPNFREGVGNGLYAGLVADIPLMDAFSLSLRGVFSQHNAVFTTIESTPSKPDTITIPSSYTLHTLTASLPSVGLDALVRWSVLGTGLNLHAGLRGAWMLAPTYNYENHPVSTTSLFISFVPQIHSVNKPFPDNSPITQAAPLQVHALAGVGYEIPLGENLRITPELTYAFALTNALRTSAAQPSLANTWALHQFRGGVTVTLPLPKTETPPPPPPADTAKPAPILAIQAFGVQEEEIGGNVGGEANETQSVILRVQQTISRSVFPLLPYIFFDGVGATALSERYATLRREETSAFRESKLSSAYELTPKEHSYYHVLNVIGERLRRLPKAQLSIHGCTDGFTAERDKADVAKARAQGVMRYLREVWQIPAAQLKLVDNTTAPTTPSIPLSDADKQAENRRVELRSDTPDILANITLIDTVRRVSPPRVRFHLSATNIDSARFRGAQWSISIRQAGRTVKELKGTTELPKTMEWRVDERELAALHLNESVQQEQTIEPLEYTFSCIDADGKLYRSNTAAIPLETRTEEKDSKRTRPERNAQGSSYFAGKLVERFNLILFDFAKSTITSEQEPMMNLMRTRITGRSTVRVDGFTDRTGEAEFNRKLSLQRALGVAQALGFTAEQQKTNVMGYGSSLELYNNDLPEGRFYSRTVRVIVETPQNE